MHPAELLFKLQVLCRLALSLSSPIQLASIGLLAVMVLRYLQGRNRLIKSPLKIGKAVKDDQTIDETPEFDVIIVGGGTAGCVLATRISEDSTIRVLLVESGDSSANVILTNIPAAYSQVFHGKHDFNLFTTPQLNAGGNARFWPRAKLLGGCSTINAMMFHYGSPSDYDEWSKALGEPLETSPWSYKNFHKYFLKFEKFVPHKDFAGVDMKFRGSEGPVEIGYAGHYSPLTRQFLDACGAVGIPRVPDVNTPKGCLGASKTMTYIDSNGRRVTVQSAYLTPDVLKRPNLKIAVKASVTRILFKNQGGKTRAIGIEFTDTAKKLRYRAYASKEVVLSAGAIHTPQILMVSGVGPSEELASHNIPIIANLPGVGAHLMDHPVIDINLRDKGKNSLSYIIPRSLKDFARLGGAMVQWMATGKGPLTCNIGEGLAFIRSRDPELFGTSETTPLPEDATSGPGAPDIELFISPVGYQEHGAVEIAPNTFAVHGVLLRPTSVGRITLSSSNPFNNPVIDPNYLSTQHDVDVLVRALKMLIRVVQSDPLSGSVDQAGSEELSLDHHLFEANDTELADFARKRMQTLYHPTSTARMAKLEDGGVVNGRLQVYGIEGLRVVDASIFPTIISGHTTAPVIAVAELASDMIKEDVRGT